MKKFYRVVRDGRALLEYFPSPAELEILGCSDAFPISQELKEQIHTNYPGLLHFTRFTTTLEGFKVECDTEEIAKTINEELNYYIESILNAPNVADKTKPEDTLNALRSQVEVLEKELQKLKNLLM
jgi:hypothetical protein